MPPPVPIILDTDMGNDIDDALALALLHRLVARGEAEIRGIVLSKSNPYAACYTDAINHLYRAPAVPMGLVTDGATPEPGSFAQTVSELRDALGRLRYARRRFEVNPPPDAVTVLRRLLAHADDASVALVTIGFFTNVARLLDSAPDDISPLSGRDLLARKVRIVSSMAGNFSAAALAAPARGHREYNVHNDLPAARRFIEHAPVEIVFSGFEIGTAALFPAGCVERDFAWAGQHPIVDGYVLYKEPPHNRPTWDLTSILYAVRPEHGYFDLSERGEVTVDDDGVTRFRADADGRHRYLKVDPAQAARLVGLFEAMCSEPV